MLTGVGGVRYYTYYQVDCVGHVWLIHGGARDWVLTCCVWAFADAIGGDREAFRRDLDLAAQSPTRTHKGGTRDD